MVMAVGDGDGGCCGWVMVMVMVVGGCVSLFSWQGLPGN